MKLLLSWASANQQFRVPLNNSTTLALFPGLSKAEGHQNDQAISRPSSIWATNLPHEIT
jgi:hypothetical protein